MVLCVGFVCCFHVFFVCWLFVGLVGLFCKAPLALVNSGPGG